VILALVAFGLLGVTGCATTRGVPSGASLVTEATVKSSFQAPADGMLWIFRTGRGNAPGQLHYSGPIGAGQVLVIDPSMNKSTIDGQELELVLPGGDVLYQAYFRPDRSVSRLLEERPVARRGMTGAAPTGDAATTQGTMQATPARDQPPPGSE
jgi:hypothetical protein